ncbi:ATP-binding protein [Anatilimnocola sp. NA78]|uniref:hybrid sensor histidine kinase/response regulator n=1 Tax=Anatilimnocola sp. NA78 TaxID=3415683 RepID=UPI003CE4B5B4
MEQGSPYILESPRAQSKDSDAAWHSLLDALPSAAYICDRQGRIIAWNLLAEQLWQQSPERDEVATHWTGPCQVLSATGLPLPSTECWAARAVFFGEACRGQLVTLSLPDGSCREVLAQANPLRGNKADNGSAHHSEPITGVLCTLTDLGAVPRTGEPWNDEPWLENEQRFTRFMQHLPGLAWIKDTKGRYAFVNDAAAAAFQRTREEIIGCTDEELFPPATAAAFRENDRQALNSTTRLETIETLQQPDGVHHSLVSKFVIPGTDGKPAWVAGMAIDITERLEATKTLAKIKDELAAQLADLGRLHDMSVHLSSTLEMRPTLLEMLRTATTFEGTARGIVSLYDEEHDCLRVGASLGFSDEFVQSIDRVEQGTGASGECLRTKERVVVQDIEDSPLFDDFRCQAREAGFRAVHATPLLTRGGRFIGVLATYFMNPHLPTSRELHLVDLCTRQAVDYIENAQLYAQLREADRRKDEFLAMLAHELRNPLAPLSNSLHILRLCEELSPAAHHVREIMERQVQHMVRLVDDLLEVSRITRGKIVLRKEPVELLTVVGSAVEASRPLIEAARHHLHIDLPGYPLCVEGDSVRLAQVMTNLLNNAAKYTEEGGEIWISARREGETAVISVRDAGLGISAEMLPKIFDMFSQVDRTTRRAQGGLGIGLTLAKSLVQMHGGTIEATSDGVGCGSEFIVHLPLALRSLPVLPTHANNGSQALADLPRRRILVVDDTRAAVYTMGRLLETMGQHVRTASSGKEALQHVEREPFDVIISDIGMPEMDGYELADKLRKHPKAAHVVLVALTGYGQDSDKLQAREAGFDYHLVKPASFDALRDLLAELPL